LKRTELIKELIQNGCYLLRIGKRHDIFINPQSKRKAPIPRHYEIKDSLCKLIRRQLGLS